MKQIHLIVFIFFSFFLSFQVQAMEDQTEYMNLEHLVRESREVFDLDAMLKFGDDTDPTGLNLERIAREYKFELQSGQSRFATMLVNYLKAMYRLQDGDNIEIRDALIENIIPKLEKDICVAVEITIDQLRMIPEIAWLKMELTIPTVEECLSPNSNHGLNLKLIAKREELLRKKFGKTEDFSTHIVLLRQTLKDLSALPSVFLNQYEKERKMRLKVALNNLMQSVLSFNIITIKQVEKIPPLD